MSSEAWVCQLFSFNWYSAKAELLGKIRTRYLKETVNYWITFPWIPTKSCPAKQINKMKESKRNAAPNEIPRIDVLQEKIKTCINFSVTHL